MRDTIRFCIPSHTVPYETRTFYSYLSGQEQKYALEYLWRHNEIKTLNPDYFPKVLIKTKMGEFVQDMFTLKHNDYFLKLVGDHFVLIHSNQRKVIQCSRSQ